jgi:DNA polymerase III delta prime subunit
MEQILFLNKYQPLYYKDCIVDNGMVHILNSLIDMNNLNILFIGDIGCGKTTFLNATVKEYYKNLTLYQYQDNILYINSLKEQGVHYYRNDVKTFCQTCSSIKNKKKIIILDDIDTINEQSQQVFRNYIDKYSNNVNFIASCSNSQKVIETLQSRFTIFKIKPLQKHHLKQIMEKITHEENINISEPAMDFILNVSNNNAKILINYMEKFKLLNQDVDLDLATSVCTNISFFIFEEYTKYLQDGNLYSAVKLLYNIYDKGYSVMDILDNYFLFVKITNTLTENQKYEIIPIICKYITIFYNIHEDEIELSLFSNNLYNILSSTT